VRNFVFGFCWHLSVPIVNLISAFVADTLFVVFSIFFSLFFRFALLHSRIRAGIRGFGKQGFQCEGR